MTAPYSIRVFHAADGNVRTRRTDGRLHYSHDGMVSPDVWTNEDCDRMFADRRETATNTRLVWETER